MKRILITGASGFIGSFITEAALRKGWDVIAAVRKTSSLTWLPHPELHIEEMDLSSPEKLRPRIKDLQERYGPLDFIIHNAGITHANRKEEFNTVNSQYTRNLAEVMASESALSKFVLISSLAAMGPGDPVTFAPLKAGDKPKPVSAYGRSKLQAEELLKSLSKVPSVIVRPTAVYGPRDRDFLQFFSMINSGLEPTIGWHRQMVSMIHVGDLAAAVIQVTECAAVGKIYLASDGGSYDKQSLGELVRKILNRKTFRIKFPLTPLKAVVGTSDFAHQLFGQLPFLNLDKLKEISSANWLCDSNALWEDIGMQPKYQLEEGLAHTAEWYKKMNWLR